MRRGRIRLLVLSAAFAGIVSCAVSTAWPTAASYRPASASASPTSTPIETIGSFEDVVVDGNVTDSYFSLAVDINKDGRFDIVKLNLGLAAGARGPNDPPQDQPGQIVWYENPSWKKREIASLSVPVSMHHADVDGDGYQDLVVGDQYGLCIFKCKPENGRIAWLRNPGANASATWSLHPIGHLMAVHRLRFGHFTQDRSLELMAFPVVGGTDGDVHAPLKVLLFSRPSNVLDAKQWPSTIANDTVRAMHGETVGKFSGTGSRLDSVLLASEEGISLLRYLPNGTWATTNIAQGEPADTTSRNPIQWKGSGDVDVGKVGADNTAYIVALEPFHGKKLVVYTKADQPQVDPNNPIGSARWTRRVLDTFGTTQPKTDEGPGHHVLTGDFDGDGSDEFLVALRGPMPTQGVYLYKVVDLAAGKFVRQRLSTISASRLAIADFDGDGRLDVASVPYVVTTFFKAQDPKVMLYLNRTPHARPAVRADFVKP